MTGGRNWKMGMHGKRRRKGSRGKGREGKGGDGRGREGKGGMTGGDGRGWEGMGGVTGKTTNGRLVMASPHGNITLSVPLPWVESPVRDAS